MIEIVHMSLWGFEHAVRGMHNFKNNWRECDSELLSWDINYEKIGENDLAAMSRLYKSGLLENRKYLRHIYVSMDILASLYFWGDFDECTVDTISNSCNPLDRLYEKEIEMGDFSHEHLNNDSLNLLKYIIDSLNFYRKKYIDTGDKEYWWQLIQLLPTSYIQRRTITMNYETVLSLIDQRQLDHLDEWGVLLNLLKISLM